MWNVYLKFHASIFDKILVIPQLKKIQEVGFKVENVCTVTLFPRWKLVDAYDVENRLGLQHGINVEIWFGFQRWNLKVDSTLNKGLSTI